MFAGGRGQRGLNLPFPIKVLCSEGVGGRVEALGDGRNGSWGYCRQFFLKLPTKVLEDERVSD